MKYTKSVEEIPKFSDSALRLYNELERLEELIDHKKREIRSLWKECEHNKNSNLWHITKKAYDNNAGESYAPSAWRTLWKRTCLKCGMVETADVKGTEDKQPSRWR